MYLLIIVNLGKVKKKKKFLAIKMGYKGLREYVVSVSRLFSEITFYFHLRFHVYKY